MPKPRLFIPIFTHFSVRYILRTGMLDALSEFVQPLIGLSWADAELEAEFKARGAEIYQVPNFTFGADFREARELLNFWHKLYRKTITTEIDLRREGSLLSLREQLSYQKKILQDRVKVSDPKRVEDLQKEEDRLFWTETNYREFDQILETARPDVIFSITPFVNKEEPLLRCAQKRGIPAITSILSFDNVTSRTRLPIPFTHYLVWNKYNRDELLRSYPYITAEMITVTGPPQFDFYYDPSYIQEEAAWRQKLDMPTGRPVILFGGGTYRIVPNEHLFLKQLDDAISAGKVAGDPVILFRRHPGDGSDRWVEVLRNGVNIRVDRSWQASESKGQINITRADIEQLCSTLYHCAVHINSSSTLSVDGAVYDRPQIGPAYDPGFSKRFDRVLKELYIREHYIPITNSGGLDVVRSKSEYIEAVNRGFTNPEERQAGRKNIISEICTFDDGKSTSRVGKKLKELVS